MRRIHSFLIAFLLFTSTAFAADTININTADKETLMQTIHGVGEKKAEAIIMYREQNGPFQSVEELTQIRGIDAGILSKNRDHLSVE